MGKISTNSSGVPSMAMEESKKLIRISNAAHSTLSGMTRGMKTDQEATHDPLS